MHGIRGDIFAADGWPSQYKGVMLQGFYWDSFDATNWNVLKSQASELGQYFSLVWLPQSANCGGQSMGYDDLYWFSNYTSSFGTEQELRDLIKAFKDNGIGTIADIVVNHRKSNNGWFGFPTETYKGVTYSMGSTDVCSNDDNGKAKAEADRLGVSLGNKDTGEGWDGMRDLDHTSTNVQNTVKAYLKMLLEDFGYVGFRYDMVKGYSGSYTKLYNEYSNPTYSVGECWDGTQTIRNWIDATEKTSAAFDFQFRYTVRNAANNGDWSNLGKQNDGNWPLISNNYQSGSYRRLAVTFVENHDTERRSNAAQDPLKKDTLAANAYLLAMPGTPCIFLTHWIDCKQALKGMIDVRRLVGIHNESTTANMATNKNYYAVRTTGSDGQLFCVVGPDAATYQPNGSWVKVLSGHHYAYYLQPSMNIAWVDCASGHYEKSFQATLTAVTEQTGAQLVYTLDGSTPSASNGTRCASGTKVSIPAEKATTLKVGLLVGSTVSVIQTRQYEVSETKPEDVSIPDFCTRTEDEVCAFFEAPLTWTSTICCWAWTDSPSDNFTYSQRKNWPGVDCTLLGTAKNGNKVWKWTWDGTKQNNSSAKQPAKIIFSNNGSPQTTELAFTNGGYYNKDGFQTQVTTVIEGVEVNSTNFPDTNFRNWVLSNISGANDGVLTNAEIANVTEIWCHGNIANLKGIEFFTAMTYLDCSRNQLTSLDVSKNTALTTLDCSHNQLTSLDVRSNMALISLSCNSNQLTSLDVSNNTALTTLQCSANKLTSSDLSKNTALTILDCSHNQLASLDVRNNMALISLSCDYNQLTSLDVSNNTALTRLYCFSNQLMELNLSNNTSIYDISLGNQITNLLAADISTGIAIPVPSELNISKVSNLKLNGTSVSGSITTVDGLKYLVFAPNGTDASSIDGKKLTYTYNTGINLPVSMPVTVSLSYSTTSYTLSIQSGSGGYVSYNGTTISNTTKSFSVESGSSATITITPNSGYRLSRLVVNSTDRTSNVSNNKYTISNITTNTTIAVTYEAIPPTTYTLSISASGGGSAIYGESSIRNTTQSFTVNKDASATVFFMPDTGYKVASVKINGSEYGEKQSTTINNINANTTIVVSFEKIPTMTYTLTVSASGNGSASYSGETIRGGSKSFTLNEGTNATITFTSDNGYRLASVKVNNTDVTSNISNNQYTISNITANTSVMATFEIVPQPFTQDGINYEIESEKDHTLNVGSGEYSGHVVIPATVTHGDEAWTVTGVADGAFDTPAITAITWNPPYAIGSGAFGNLTNPNLLLYVKDAAYAPANVQNVIANGRARKIVLTDATSGNDFDCPKAFTAEEISYTHHYSMTTGIGECRGWETIALPFDLKQFTHETKGALIPFKAYYSGNLYKPFWLYELTSSGFMEAAGIEANKPYIISMPNNNYYVEDYHMAGLITFSAEKVTVMKSADVWKTTCGDKTFIPSFASKAAAINIYALNVNNDYCTNTDYRAEGSTFLREFRTVHPFEAYMTTNLNDAKSAMPIFEDLPTTIPVIPLNDDNDEKRTRIFNLSGQQMKLSGKSSLKKDLERLPAGVYIVNGKKLIIW